MAGIDDTPSPFSSGDLLDRMARSLAHNLNNRLTGVVGYLELALQEPGIPAAAARHLHTSLECALDVVRMLRRVSAFAIRTTTPPGQICSPAAVLEQAAGRLTQSASHLSIHVVAESRAQIPVSGRLVQLAVDQLIDNALESMPRWGALTLRLWEDSGEVCVSVKDTGTGLTPYARAHLFEPFITNKAAGHLGLGLALCQMVVQSFGGAVTIESEVGKGTTATIRFPPVGVMAGAEQRTSAETSPRGPGMRVNPPSSVRSTVRRPRTGLTEEVSKPSW